MITLNFEYPNLRSRPKFSEVFNTVKQARDWYIAHICRPNSPVIEYLGQTIEGYDYPVILEGDEFLAAIDEWRAMPTPRNPMTIQEMRNAKADEMNEILRKESHPFLDD